MKNLFLYKIKPNLSHIIGLAALVLFYAVVGCPLRCFFGICCPGCGMTRATLSILKLDFAGAFSYHPLVFIMPVCALVFILRKKLSAKVCNGLIALAVILFLGVYIYRLVTGNEYVYIDFSRGLIYRIIDFLKTYSGG